MQHYQRQQCQRHRGHPWVRIAASPANVGVITIANSVVSGNTNANGPDILSSMTVNVNSSAIGSDTGFIPSATSGNNLPAGTNLLLGALGNNGGPTQSMLPAAGSPLINAGSSALAAGVATDQRGFGFVRSFGTADIGAIEVQPGDLPVASATGPTVTTAGATTYTFAVTFTDLNGPTIGINVASVIGNNAAVRVTGPGGFDVPATFVSIDNPSNGSPRTATYSITPPGGSWDAVEGGNFSVNVQTGQVADQDGNFVPAGSAGSFAVNIPNFLVLNANDTGFGSFRQALAFAIADPAANTITFDPVFFNTPRTITVETILPQITAAGGALTITGPGSANLTLRRDPAAPPNPAHHIRIRDSTTTSLNISGIRIAGGSHRRHGRRSDNPRRRATINLTDVIFSGNAGDRHRRRRRPHVTCPNNTSPSPTARL